MRMVMQVVPEAQEADVKILEMWVGIVDKSTGAVAYKPETKLTFETRNVVLWKGSGTGGLKVVNKSTATASFCLPWWFPMPDVFVKRVAEFFLGRVSSNGQKAVNKQIENQYAEWMTK
ncbi:unnamed protein product [Prorocentrum cordatum]|uniref:SRPBCC family protein n=1 Tax=Prorocentrum cordatum TaxID=2364126 RepID=A0ABN9X163_9DINO|nr:unnamed protein product [Polarella glacialis]